MPVCQNAVLLSALLLLCYLSYYFSYLLFLCTHLPHISPLSHPFCIPIWDGSVGFNPMWEETLVFMIHMPELALVRFLVWDHDPIGQDFIGQRTIAFNSMMPGKTWCCFWMALTLVQGFLLCFSDYILKQGTRTGNSLYKLTIHLLYITNLVLLIPSLC